MLRCPYCGNTLILGYCRRCGYDEAVELGIAPPIEAQQSSSVLDEVCPPCRDPIDELMEGTDVNDSSSFDLPDW